LDFNDSRLTRPARSFDISEVQGAKDIISFPAKPVKYIESADGNEEDLMVHGNSTIKTYGKHLSIYNTGDPSVAEMPCNITEISLLTH